MQQESEPENIEKLQHQLITKRIELEALKKESDPDSLVHKGEIEKEIEEMQSEFNELNQVNDVKTVEMGERERSIERNQRNKGETRDC